VYIFLLSFSKKARLFFYNFIPKDLILVWVDNGGGVQPINNLA